MSDRLVIPGFFKVLAAIVDWNKQAALHNHAQSFIFGNQDEPARVHLRWLVNPRLGLSRHPFQVFSRAGDPGPLDLDTRRALAQLDDWDKVEIVGLPVNENDPDWSNVYDTSAQGLFAAPVPPLEAALRRLEVGAPRFGWDPLTVAGLNLPVWEDPNSAPDLKEYLVGLQKSRIMLGLLEMLGNQPDLLKHYDYVDEEKDTDGLTTRLVPHLIAAPGISGSNRPARTSWRPLQLAGLSVSTDPFASLGLGFGTAVDLKDVEQNTYMVTVFYEFPELGIKIELADVVTADPLAAPDPPTSLVALDAFHSRPAHTDDPFLEAIQVNWDRPPSPDYQIENILPLGAISPGKAYPASYAIGRFRIPDEHDRGRADILLEPRRETHGWLPLGGSHPVKGAGQKPDVPLSFTDTLLRSVIVNQDQVVASPFSADLTYAVAAQDLFGRWSIWQTVDLHVLDEKPQVPGVLGVSLDPSGLLDILFSWDWSDRSPQFIELTGNYTDDPATLFDIRIVFNGSAQPAALNAPQVLEPFQLLPADASAPSTAAAQTANRQTFQLAAGFGAPQDPHPDDPAARYYRLRLPFTFDFNGLPERTLLVRATAKEHVLDIFLPGAPQGISDPSPDVSLCQYDPTPPDFQGVPVEAPQFASLPDASGVSRAVISWANAPGAAGYVLYEAAETTLLAAFQDQLNLVSPDLTEPLTTRLARLRGQDLPGKRNFFRRVQPELIRPAGGRVSYEVALPRGSQVMHFYTITAVSANGMETPFPTDHKAYIAVAAPRLVIPPPPALQAVFDPLSGTVQLVVDLAVHSAIRKVELFRTTNGDIGKNAGVDSFGPPITTPPPQVSGLRQTFTDLTPPAGWKRVYYTAVAWAADDPLTGSIGTRSVASTPQPLLIPPSTPPDLSGLQVNLAGSTVDASLVSWTSSAPPVKTDLGLHGLALEIRDEAEALLSRFASDLKDVQASAATPAPTPAISVFHLSGGQPNQYFAWAPRPVAGQPFKVKVKMIDPLGRITSASADVPVPLSVPQLSDIFFPVHSPFSIPNLTAASWQILSTVDANQAHQYSLEVTILNPATPGQKVTIQKSLDQAVEIPPGFNPGAAQLGALLFQVLRIKDTQTYLRITANVHHLQVIVTLTDPLGQQDTQQGEIP